VPLAAKTGDEDKLSKIIFFIIDIKEKEFKIIVEESETKKVNLFSLRLF